MPLRAARWSRVSSNRQAEDDRTGLPYQREAQDRAIERNEWTDTGIAWEVAESGGTVHGSPEFLDMLARAGRDFDVLVVAYASRLGRNASETLRASEEITRAGARIYFAQERLDTSDERQWEYIAREHVDSEVYRRRLSRTMKETYELRARRKGLPAGKPPYGYDTGWTVNEPQAAIVRAIFREYATTDISLRALAEKYGLAEDHIKGDSFIRNPAYAGLVQHRGVILGEGSMPAIVDRAIWDRVAAKREDRRFVAGGQRPTLNPYAGKLYCACGSHIRSNGRGGTRIRHLPPVCTTWDPARRRKQPQQHRPVEYVVAPLREAVKSLWGSYGVAVEMIATQTAPQPPPDNRFARERLARRFAKGEITLERFTTEIASLEQAPAAPERPVVTVEDLHGYWEPFRTTDYDRIASSIARRIEYRGPDRLGVELSDDAKAHFVGEMLPREVKLSEWAVRGRHPQAQLVLIELDDYHPLRDAVRLGS